MVESFANSVEDKLIDSLQFKLKEGASYITDRRSVTFYPQGSNIYRSQNGTKTIKINLTGDHWLDPSTLRVMFEVRNNSANANLQLRPISGPWVFFRRARLVSSSVIEDIDHYGRCHEMLHILKSKEIRKNDFSEAFGEELTFLDDIMGLNRPARFSGIPGAQSQNVLFKPIFGLLNQPKYLPLKKMGGLSIELELNDNYLDAIVDPDVEIVADRYNTANTSTDYQIENVMVKVDLITLDNALQNTYDSHLLSGNAYPINYNTYINSVQSVIGAGANGQDKINLSISRAITRLKSVFITLDRETTYDIYGGEMGFKAMKPWNQFYSPMNIYGLNPSGNAVHNQTGEFEVSIQIGSKKFPENEIKGHAHAFYELKKCLGLQATTLKNLDIRSSEYRMNKLIIGIDTEKQLTAGWTGMNTKAGDLLNIKFNHLLCPPERRATQMYVTLHADCVLEIRDSGVEIYD